MKSDWSYIRNQIFESSILHFKIILLLFYFKNIVTLLNIFKATFIYKS